MVDLYGRKTGQVELCKVKRKFKNYEQAVREGSRIFGWGNYMVVKHHGDGDRTPSREQQLLEPKWNPNDLEQRGL